MDYEISLVGILKKYWEYYRLNHCSCHPMIIDGKVYFLMLFGCIQCSPGILGISRHLYKVIQSCVLFLSTYVIFVRVMFLDKIYLLPSLRDLFIMPSICLLSSMCNVERHVICLMITAALWPVIYGNK